MSAPMSTSTPAALQRRREYAGPALFAYGFRPFFLAAGLWAAFGILLWLPQFLGLVTLPTVFGALDWHIHEMLYGYVAAAIAGFLLTAIPNWTGRLPVSGWPLAGLAALWLAGRVAILFSSAIGGVAAAAIDVSFLVTLAAVAAREIVAGRNWRNLRVLIVLAVLAAGNVVFHAEVLTRGAADYGIRIALAAVVGMIMLIGGRIVPSFTNNWLARNNPGRKPVPFSRFDMLVIAASAVALIGWVAAPFAVATGALLLAAGVLHLVRLARWAGDRTLRDRLVLILHVAYFFVPLGFLLMGASLVWPAGAGERRHPCLDRRRRRPDDARGDDPRHPRPYRPRVTGRAGDADDLRRCAARRAVAHRGGLHRFAHAHRLCRRRLGYRLCHFRCGLRAAPGIAQAGLGRRARLSSDDQGGSIGTDSDATGARGAQPK